METQRFDCVPASEEDRDTVIYNLAYNMLIEEYKTREFYDVDSLNNIFTSALRAGTIWVFKDEGVPVGVLASLPSKHPFNTNLSILSEVIWYVLPEYRNGRAAVSLFKMFEDEAKKYDLSSFSLLPGENVGVEFIKRKGYGMKEYGFLKVN